MNEVVIEFPHLAELPPNLDDSITGTPERRPCSVRRTSTIDMVWPGGFGTPLNLVGRARDLLTAADGSTRVLDEASMLTEIGDFRTVRAIETVPERGGIDGLVGAVGGSDLRRAIDEVLPGEREAGTPLHLLLDDIAGTSLIAGFAWMRSAQRENSPGRGPQEGRTAQRAAAAGVFGRRKGKIICSGLRPDGFADVHRRSGRQYSAAIVQAGNLGLESDPLGWHELPPDPEVGMRRHRRIDIWSEDDVIRVDGFFRDACWEPDGTQMALHEYDVQAEIEPVELTVLSVKATPHVLPYPECQWAAPHAEQVRGMPVADFRTSVQRTLTELQACTHLNDMLRCLAEVPALAPALGEQNLGA